jgi:hypothetical protein
MSLQIEDVAGNARDSKCKKRVPVYLYKNDWDTFSQIAKNQGKSAAELLRYHLEKLTDDDIKKLNSEQFKAVGPVGLKENKENIHFINFYMTPDNISKIKGIAQSLNTANNPKVKQPVVMNGNIIQYIINTVVVNSVDVDSKDEDTIVKSFVTIRANIYIKIKRYAESKHTRFSELIALNFEYFSNSEFEKYRKYVLEEAPLTLEEVREYSNTDCDTRRQWKATSIVGSFREKSNLRHFIIENPATGIKYPVPDGGWKYAKNTIDHFIEINRIVWPEKHSGLPMLKVYMDEATSLTKASISIPSKMDAEIEERIKLLNADYQQKYDNDLLILIAKNTEKTRSELKKELKQKFMSLNVMKSGYMRAFLMFICDKIDIS